MGPGGGRWGQVVHIHCRVWLHWTVFASGTLAYERGDALSWLNKPLVARSALLVVSGAFEDVDIRSSCSFTVFCPSVDWSQAV